MPCLCQYFATEPGLRVEDSLNVTDTHDDSASNDTGPLTEVISGTITPAELVACKAETLLLKRNLSTANISAENMEILMKSMIEKQNVLMTQVFELRKMNEDLRLQQVNDRNNQALERGILLQELHEIKNLLRDRSNVVGKTLELNNSLTNALRDANEKIYEMGMKYLKLKNNRLSSRDGSSKGSILSD